MNGTNQHPINSAYHIHSNLHVQNVFALAGNNLHMQKRFAHAIKAAHAGNFLHMQGINCMHVHVYDGNPYLLYGTHTILIPFRKITLYSMTMKSFLVLFFYLSGH